MGKEGWEGVMRHKGVREVVEWWQMVLYDVCGVWGVVVEVVGGGTPMAAQCKSRCLVTGRGGCGGA